MTRDPWSKSVGATNTRDGEDTGIYGGQLEHEEAGQSRASSAHHAHVRRTRVCWLTAIAAALSLVMEEHHSRTCCPRLEDLQRKGSRACGSGCAEDPRSQCEAGRAFRCRRLCRTNGPVAKKRERGRRSLTACRQQGGSGGRANGMTCTSLEKPLAYVQECRRKQEFLARFFFFFF